MFRALAKLYGCTVYRLAADSASAPPSATVVRAADVVSTDVHFHCCVSEGVFVAGADGQVQFAEAAALRPEDLAAVQQ